MCAGKGVGAMKLGEEIFAIKLYELERQYGKLQNRLRVCGREDEKKLHEELEKAKGEYEKNQALLKKSVEGCRNPAVAELARAQWEYGRKVGNLLKESDRYFHSETGTPQEDKAEASTLYAEYAIDFAVQSMKYAVLAALMAVDQQMETEEQKEEN